MSIATRYHHTNIVARDPERLTEFYAEVLGCVRTPPDRNLEGEWLERGTGLKGARIHGIFLRFPGHGDEGPSLEIYSLDEMAERIPSVVNGPGFRHIAFSVDDVEATLARLLAAGGEKLGEPVEALVAGVGRAGFVYARDPEGNIVELLEWR